VDFLRENLAQVPEAVYLAGDVVNAPCHIIAQVREKIICRRASHALEVGSKQLPLSRFCAQISAAEII